jgi:hypothetical protein
VADCGCGVDRFRVSAIVVFCVSVVVGWRSKDGVWVGEHDPDCVERDCEEVACEEERGWCDSEERGGTKVRTLGCMAGKWG